MLFVVLCPGTPEGSSSSGSGFKASQKTGNGLKSHPTDWEKPGIETANLCHVSILYVLLNILSISSMRRVHDTAVNFEMQKE